VRARGVGRVDRRLARVGRLVGRLGNVCGLNRRLAGIAGLMGRVLNGRLSRIGGLSWWHWDVGRLVVARVLCDGDSHGDGGRAI
jgi:hypothetical protein